MISRKVDLLVKDYYSLDKEIITDHSIRFNINENLKPNEINRFRGSQKLPV